MLLACKETHARAGVAVNKTRSGAGSLPPSRRRACNDGQQMAAEHQPFIKQALPTTIWCVLEALSLNMGWPLRKTSKLLHPKA